MSKSESNGFFHRRKLAPLPVPGPYPLFNRISIETLSYCNRSCHFCPLHWSQDERGRKPMSDQLYAKIVAELGALGFDGMAQMFLLSEPTIDKKMRDRLTLLRDACPDVTTYISTNGDVFDKILQRDGERAFLSEVHSYYDAGLTVLNINVYDSGNEQMARYQRMKDLLLKDGSVTVTKHKYHRHKVGGRFLAINDMRIESNATASSTSKLYIKPKNERAAIKAPSAYCARPHRHFVVEWDGNVPICCAIDVTDKSLPSMGNVNDQTIEQIWNGLPMQKYRYFTQDARRVLPGCDTCTHKMAYSHAVRLIKPDEDLVKQWESEVAGMAPRLKGFLQ